MPPQPLPPRLDLRIERRSRTASGCGCRGLHDLRAVRDSVAVGVHLDVESGSWLRPPPARRLTAHREQRVPPALGGELVLGVDAEDRVRAAGRASRRSPPRRRAGAHRVAQLEERAQRGRYQRVTEARRVRRPRRCRRRRRRRAAPGRTAGAPPTSTSAPLSTSPSSPKKLTSTLGRSVWGRSCCVALVQEPEALAHQPALDLEAPGQAGQREVGLGQAHLRASRSPSSNSSAASIRTSPRA